MKEYNPDDPFEPAPDAGIPLGGGGGGGCGAGTVPESIGADGNWRTAGPGECIDMAEYNKRVDMNIKNNPNKSEGAPSGFDDAAQFPGGAPKYNFGKAPMFTAPQFGWNEKFTAPSAADMANEPGYAFRLKQGMGAMQNSAAAKGFLRTGATVKDLGNYAQDYASQEYGNVFNRALTGYNTRYGTARDIFDRYYTGKKDEFAPKYGEWQTLTAAEQHSKDLAWQAAIQKWYHDNLSASQIYGQG